MEIGSFDTSSVVPLTATGNVTITATARHGLLGDGQSSAVFFPGGSTTGTTLGTVACPPDPCVDSATSLRTTTYPGSVTIPVAQLTGARLQYVVSNPQNRPIEVWLDGMTISVSYTATMRATANTGSTYVSGTSGAVLKASGAWSATQLAIRGTVYAPAGVVDLAVTGVPHEVVDRGIIARHARLAMTPAGAYAGPLISIPRIDQDPRNVFVVVRDASANVMLRAEVTLANSTGTINGDIPRINRWSQQ
jgi:hypothetical protein